MVMSINNSFNKTPLWWRTHYVNMYGFKKKEKEEDNDLVINKL